jgi:hypothetical protein
MKRDAGSHIANGALAPPGASAFAAAQLPSSAAAL